MAKLQVLFEGTDSLNRKNLWVTDGTAAGTSELTITGFPPADCCPLEIPILRL
jgi:hypothetical protein